MSSKFGSTVQLPVGMRHSSLPPAFPVLLIGVVGVDDHLPGLKSSDLHVEMRQQGAGERELLEEGETKEMVAFLKSWCVLWYLLGFPGGARGKEPICQCRRHKRCSFDP